MYTNCHVFANRTRDLIEKRTTYSDSIIEWPFKIANLFRDFLFISNYVVILY